MMTDYDMLGVADYMATAAANASQTTFGSAMTHNAIMQEDGSMNFSQADALVSWAKSNNVGVFGRTLVWHKNQNVAYLSQVAAPPAVQYFGPNIVQNPTLNDNLDGYEQLNPNPGGGCGPRIAQEDGRNGTKGLYVDGTCDAITADDYWRVQIRSMLNSKMEKDGIYRVEFWIKAKVAGTVQVETREASGADAQYQTFDATTEWAKVSLEFTAKGTDNAFCFDLNNANHTEYWVDDVAVYQVSDVPLNMIANPAMDDNIDGYSQMNPNSAGACGLRISHTDEGRNGTGGLYVDGTCDAITAADYWRVQIGVNFLGTMTAGVDYVIEFYIKAKLAGAVQFEIRG
jgi:hypothetical protein